MRRTWMAIIVLATGLSAGAAESDFLQVQGTELYLHGKPFYEISFNKIDLFWQILASELGRGGFGNDPVGSAEEALKELSGLGFKTIRIASSCPEYSKEATRPRFLAALDRTLDLCDKYDLRVVFCLGSIDVSFAKACDEPYTDLLTREESKSRQMSRQYVRELVLRYRDRKTIAVWEHGNELLLKADIGGRTRTWGDLKVPTLDEVALFHTQEAAFIRSLDAKHPITSGDSYRNCIWSLYESGQGKPGDGWAVNTMEEIGRGVARAQKAVDLFCIHSYYRSVAYGSHSVKQADGSLAALNLGEWTRIAHAQGKPLYIGEYGILPVARTEKNRKFWEENPEWFESYEGADQAKAVRLAELALKQVVGARPNLTHWWCYQSNRNHEQNNPQRFDIDVERTPELVRLVVEANRALQMKTMGFTYMKSPEK